MTENPPHSGSRWEPKPTDPSDPPEAVSTPPRTRLQRWRGRRAPLAAAAAVGLVAAAGTGGFVIGHEVRQGTSDGTSLTDDSRDGRQPGAGDGRQFGDREGDDGHGFGDGRPGDTYGGPGGTGTSTDGTGRQTTYRVPLGTGA